jgi:hypothetical protein
MKKIMIAVALLAACGIAFAAGTSWRDAPTFIRKITQDTSLHRVIDQETGAICYITHTYSRASSADGSSISCLMRPPAVQPVQQSTPQNTRPRWQRQSQADREWLAQH